MVYPGRPQQCWIIRLLSVFSKRVAWLYRKILILWLHLYKVFLVSEISYCCMLVDILRRLTWWRHHMETFSASLALCEGSHRSPESLVFPDLHLNTKLSKWSRRRWFETPSRSLWRHCNELRVSDGAAFATTSDIFIWTYLLTSITPSRSLLTKSCSNGKVLQKLKDCVYILLLVIILIKGTPQQSMYIDCVLMM